MTSKGHAGINKLMAHNSRLSWLSPALLFLGSLGVVSLVLLWIFIQSFPGYLPVDDSYICLGFARNVWEYGEFFSYNPGEISTGITSPLYAVLLAGVFGLVRDWHVAVLVLGAITFVCALLLGQRLAYRVGGYWAAVAFVCFFGFSGHMAFFALFGMEPMLYIMLSFAAFLAFFESRCFLAGLFSGLAMLCRPESLFILFVMLAALSWKGALCAIRKDWVGVTGTLSSAWRMCAGFAIPALPWMLRCRVVSGAFLCSTVAKKTYGFSFAHVWSYWVSSMRMFFPSSLDNLLIQQAARPTFYVRFRECVPLTVVAAFALPFIRKQVLAMAPFFFIPVHLVITGVKNADCADSERYLCLNYALTYLYLAVLVGVLVRVERGRALPVLRKVAAWCGLVVLASMLLADYSRHIDIYRLKARYFYNLDYKIGEWLAKNTPPETRVALFQAGGIKFFSGRYIIDGDGVTEHTIWPYLERRAFSEAMVDRGADFVAPFGPDWLQHEGIFMSDTRLFRQVPLQCRGLYLINKPALSEVIKAKKDKTKYGLPRD